MAETSGKGLRVPKNPAMALRELNRKHAAVVAPPDTGNNTTILQTDKQTDPQTNPQTSQQLDKQTDQPTDNPTNTLESKATRRSNERPDERTSSRTTKRAASPSTSLPAEPERRSEPAGSPRPRVDGRTLRARQPSADITMVTSFRLAVPTIEALDAFCWEHRMRKQDVVQAALDLYFQEMAAGQDALKD